MERGYDAATLRHIARVASVGESVTSTTELFVNDAGTLANHGGAGLEIGDMSPLSDYVDVSSDMRPMVDFAVRRVDGCHYAQRVAGLRDGVLHWGRASG